MPVPGLSRPGGRGTGKARGREEQEMGTEMGTGMDFTTDGRDRADEIVALFEAVFGASEGADEGRMIGGLARHLLRTTAAEDLVICSCRDGGALVGCILFTRLTFAEDPRTVFLLAPVAVATDRQREGIGQALLRYGLETMRARGADVAVTYGDPAYYGKVGFAPVGTDIVAPPQPLSMPHGWQAQSLTGAPLEPLKGPSRCVEAFDAPAYW